MKRILVAAALLLAFTSSVFATDYWHCIASNNAKYPAVWNYFAATKAGARDTVEKACSRFNNHQYCNVVCFPPHVVWRCESHDLRGIDPKTGKMRKQGTWFWTSTEDIEIAMNGARDACRHNSSYGGCYVNPKECAKS